jgi:CheY-like chemotaxis protein
MADGEREQLRNETQRLRVLIANERADRLETVREIVEALGHDVIARSIEVRQVGEVTRRERPDVALVGLGESSEHALELIEKIVHEATCPVIALLHAADTAWVNEAAKRGIFAYITDGDADQLQSALDIVLRRFAEYHNLEGAFGRRAMIDVPRASTWQPTESTNRKRSSGCAPTPNTTGASSSTSPKPSSRATDCSYGMRTRPRASPARVSAAR